MNRRQPECPDCAAPADRPLDRRQFLAAGSLAAAATTIPLLAPGRAAAKATPASQAELIVKDLFDSFTDQQRQKVCFAWDHQDPKRGLLRTFVSNNWHITEPTIASSFYTKKQQDQIHEVFKAVVNPDWYPKFRKQLKDDTGGKDWGAAQNIAVFGTPGSGKFEMVMTGRHMTLRADGGSAEHVAFGGPIFYGHAASGFTEKPHHPGNVFWHQAELANNLYKHLDDKQQQAALIPSSPAEAAVEFHGRDAKLPGVAVGGFSDDQKKEVRKVLAALVEPFRKEDREEVEACLGRQGGLDQCRLSFYKDERLGEGEWDNWRLEGPSFVWYFRGYPHVHVWVNVADDPGVRLNANG